METDKGIKSLSECRYMGLLHLMTKLKYKNKKKTLRIKQKLIISQLAQLT